MQLHCLHYERGQGHITKGWNIPPSKLCICPKIYRDLLFAKLQFTNEEQILTY